MDQIFKRLGCAFVYWYNVKYERVGHLFQDRYRSEIVKTDYDFLKVLRYILQNPVRGGLCKDLRFYSYSSGKDYFYAHSMLTDIEYAFGIMDMSTLRSFILEENDDKYLEMNDLPKKRITDEMAKKMILQEFGTFSPVLNKPDQRQIMKEALIRLHEQGASIRQLSRLTGIPKKIIETSIKKETENRPLSPVPGKDRDYRSAFRAGAERGLPGRNRGNHD